MGLVAGARSVADLEALTASMSAAARRWFRLARKLPDTTARDLLVRLAPEELRGILHVRSFHRQKALEPEGFRWGVVSMDGKASVSRAWDQRTSSNRAPAASCAPSRQRSCRARVVPASTPSRSRPPPTRWAPTSTLCAHCSRAAPRNTRGRRRRPRAWRSLLRLQHGARFPRARARLIRARWAVENNNHHTFDTALAEDARPWFHEHPVGALDVIILRRIAYNAMALFRARTLRADAHHLMPWRALTRQVLIALISATEAAVIGLRARAPP